MIENNHERLLTQQELTDILKEHIGKHENIKQHELFLAAAISLINGTLENFTEEYDEKSKIKFQTDMLNKFTDYVQSFHSKKSEYAASFSLDKKEIQLGIDSYKRQTINYAKAQKLPDDQFNTLANDINNDKPTNALSQKYYDIYLFNLYISLLHEFLHAVKVQEFNYNDFNTTNYGFALLSLTHKPFAKRYSPYFALEETINSLHEISLISNSNDYKNYSYYTNENSIGRGEKPIRYYVEHSFLNLIAVGDDKNINCKSPYLACEYFNAINIAELMEMLIGKTKLFEYSKDNAFGLYAEFKLKYFSTITKYLNKINILLKKELDDLKNIEIIGEFTNIEDFEKPSPLFVLSMLIQKSIKIQPKNYFDCQELAQSILINCLSTKVENIYLSDYVDELKETKNEINDLLKNVSGCAFKPRQEILNKYDCEKELKNFNEICNSKIKEIDKLISKYSSEERGIEQ